jgi:hypothetical protein
MNKQRAQLGLGRNPAQPAQLPFYLPFFFFPPRLGRPPAARPTPARARPSLLPVSLLPGARPSAVVFLPPPRVAAPAPPLLRRIAPHSSAQLHRASSPRGTAQHSSSTTLCSAASGSSFSLCRGETASAALSNRAARVQGRELDEGIQCPAKLERRTPPASCSFSSSSLPTSPPFSFPLFPVKADARRRAPPWPPHPPSSSAIGSSCLHFSPSHSPLPSSRTNFPHLPPLARGTCLLPRSRRAPASRGESSGGPPPPTSCLA